MIISQTPFRISFVGGGSDLRSYYQQGYGAVVSTTINKYMYITVNRRFDRSIRVSYSKTEIINRLEELKHPIVKEALIATGVHNGVEITSIGDVPAGTGLGSSSSFTVGLLHALYAYSGVYKSAEFLANKASEIEIERLKEPIGKQDQYAAAYGGLNYIQFNKDESVSVEPIICSRDAINGLNRNLMMFYLGMKRKASTILSEQKKKMGSSEGKKRIMDKMVELTSDMKRALSTNDLIMFGELLHKNWLLKKKMASKISNPLIDEYYEKAMKAGALGGKVLGAGGGGFILLYCDEKNHGNVQKALHDLRQINFKLDPRGTRIIYYGE